MSCDSKWKFQNYIRCASVEKHPCLTFKYKLPLALAPTSSESSRSTAPPCLWRIAAPVTLTKHWNHWVVRNSKTCDNGIHVFALRKLQSQNLNQKSTNDLVPIFWIFSIVWNFLEFNSLMRTDFFFLATFNLFLHTWSKNLHWFSRMSFSTVNLPRRYCLRRS